jgi:hypothetical protein
MLLNAINKTRKTREKLSVELNAIKKTTLNARLTNAIRALTLQIKQKGRKQRQTPIKTRSVGCLSFPQGAQKRRPYASFPLSARPD